jgi:hypothetical protein
MLDYYEVHEITINHDDEVDDELHECSFLIDTACTIEQQKELLIRIMMICEVLHLRRMITREQIDEMLCENIIERKQSRSL